MWEFRHDTGTYNTDPDSSTALDDKQPLPAGDIVDYVELEDGCCEQATERIADLLGYVKTGDKFASNGGDCVIDIGCNWVSNDRVDSRRVVPRSRLRSISVVSCRIWPKLVGSIVDGCCTRASVRICSR